MLPVLVTLIKKRELFVELELGQNQYKFIILCLINLYMTKPKAQSSETLQNPETVQDLIQSEQNDNSFEDVLTAGEISEFMQVIGEIDVENASVLNESFSSMSVTDW